MNESSYNRDHIYNAANMTTILRYAVPSLNAVEFTFIESRKGYVKSLLPLNAFSSNQHGTHQALILAMGGDYTGGLALATLLGEEPILGVHEVTHEKSMSLWLLGSKMEYLSPSTEDVFIEAKLDVGQEEKLQQRYHLGGTIIMEIEVSFKTLRGKLVSKGQFKYYCKKKNALAVTRPGKRINAMFEHIIKTSAKLIARLRANEAQEENPLFIDTLAAQVAGKQGMVMADRFVEGLPELQHMVAARTHHLDEMLRQNSNLIRQVVFVGAGLDFRTYRLADVLGHVNLFELDLQEMIEEREALEQEYELRFSDAPSPVRIGCNFLTDSIAEKLLSNGFDPQQPSFFIYEGCAMYFSREENKKILTELTELLSIHSDSLLWMDKVDEKALSANNSSASLHKFLSNMAKLGEPFIYGFDAENSLLKEVGLSPIATAITSDFKSLPPSEIYKLYSFNLLKAQ